MDSEKREAYEKNRIERKERIDKLEEIIKEAELIAENGVLLQENPEDSTIYKVIEESINNIESIIQSTHRLILGYKNVFIIEFIKEIKKNIASNKDNPRSIDGKVPLKIIENASKIIRYITTIIDLEITIQEDERMELEEPENFLLLKEKEEKAKEFLKELDKMIEEVDNIEWYYGMIQNRENYEEVIKIFSNIELCFNTMYKPSKIYKGMYFMGSAEVEKEREIILEQIKTIEPMKKEKDSFIQKGNIKKIVDCVKDINTHLFSQYNNFMKLKIEQEKILSDIKDARKIRQLQKKVKEQKKETIKVAHNELGKGFTARYTKLEWEYWITYALFIVINLLLFGLLGWSAYDIYILLGKDIISPDTTNNMSDILDKTLIRLILTISVSPPLIWIIQSLSKKAQQARRLMEEYAHKESVSIAFVGYRNELIKLASENGAHQEEAKKTLVNFINNTTKEITTNVCCSIDTMDKKSIKLLAKIGEKTIAAELNSENCPTAEKDTK